MQSINLLGTTSRVQVPVVKVKIGNYTFGVRESNGNKINFPNLVQSLTVSKLNGIVNQYTLVMTYAITDRNDPNFMEKVFSSVSKTRSAILSYGDLSQPTFIYKEETATITKVKSDFNIQSSTITYTLSLISNSGKLKYNTINYYGGFEKPSDVIKRYLNDSSTGLKEIFYGMTNNTLVADLIPGNDKAVEIDAQLNVSILEFITFLVSCMIPDTGVGMSVNKGNFYYINVYDDTTNIYGGPYFKITELKGDNTSNNSLTTYYLDIGTMSKDVILNFSIDDDETYSLLCEYGLELNDAEYRQGINDDGELYSVYYPLSMRNDHYQAQPQELTWWKQVTQFPIKATVTIKGLIRPAVLMSYVNLNIYFYGRKSIKSGTYIVLSQTDTINMQGYTTTLSLQRIGEDESLV